MHALRKPNFSKHKGPRIREEYIIKTKNKYKFFSLSIPQNLRPIFKKRKFLPHQLSPLVSISSWPFLISPCLSVYKVKNIKDLNFIWISQNTYLGSTCGQYVSPWLSESPLLIQYRECHLLLQERFEILLHQWVPCSSEMLLSWFSQSRLSCTGLYCQKWCHRHKLRLPKRFSISWINSFIHTSTIESILDQELS